MRNFPTAIRSFFVATVFLLASGATSSLHAQVNDQCLTCHSDESLTMERKGKTVSLHVKADVMAKSPHAKLVCTACHTGFDPDNLPHKDPITPVNCLTCHANAPTKHKFHPQLAASKGTNGAPGMSCKTCHGTHDVVRPSDPASKWSLKNQPASCGTCHGEVKKLFLASAHGNAWNRGVKGAPGCVECHQEDITRIGPGRDSAVVKLAQEEMCMACHRDNPDVRSQMTPTAGFIAAYGQSVHGKALQAGNGSAAACSDCHGSHDVLPGSDPASKVHRRQIVGTCGQCHLDIGEEFNESVHGVADREGNTDSPTCTGCHGEHNILKHDDPRSPVAAKNISAQVCSPCHASVRLSEKYGIQSDRFATFTDSFHGLAIEGGKVGVANCASCHGAHNIKPSSDPTSMVHKDNLPKTCGSCHPGANERFAVGSVHVTTTTSSTDPTLYWISTVYVWLIILTIGGMTVHNIADFVRKSIRKLRERRGHFGTPHAVGHRLYLRMSFEERLQHGTFAISFIMLVVTGFMLRYPSAWWVVALRDLAPWEGDLRSFLHRSAGVAMIAASFWHIYYVFATERGRQLIFDLMPTSLDLKEMIAQMRYNFGFSNDRPQLGRFSYIEKAEYWALVWGTVVMTATGIFMWFDNTFINLLTKQGYDIARTIHFYEAWLATLAIIVWHFYFVIFNPEAYPINLAFLKGTISEHEMAEEHPRELAEIKRREGGDLDVQPDEPEEDVK
ncbi:MAG: cytochrome b/b6 domain-containing protein [Bacteroidetes bacterium]|jgi:cytochrome b subunit of formate dehydrogenase|nr:cytochrome b/b6 domain-containing protein [Bacteroidota bacterium]